MLRPAPFLIGLAVCASACGGPSDPYVGTWERSGPDALGSRTTFRADGTARIVERPPVGEPQTYDAQYEVTGDSVLTLSDGQGAERFRLQLDGDTLRLQSPNGEMETVWVRL